MVDAGPHTEIDHLDTRMQWQTIKQTGHAGRIIVCVVVVVGYCQSECTINCHQALLRFVCISVAWQ